MNLNLKCVTLTVCYSLIYLSNSKIWVMTCVYFACQLAGRLSLKKDFNFRHHTQIFQPVSFIPATIICTVNPYNFVTYLPLSWPWLSVTRPTGFRTSLIHLFTQVPSDRAKFGLLMKQHKMKILILFFLNFKILAFKGTKWSADDHNSAGLIVEFD